MSVPAIALAVGGPVAVALAWTVVRTGRLSVWTAMGVCMGTLGSLALLLGEPRLGESPPAPAAAAVGLGSGMVLYLATAAFLAVARRWEVLARHAAGLYALRGRLPLAAALVLAAGISAGGEELFWRGLVQAVAVRSLGDLPGAALAWVAYVGANVFSRSTAIILGAVVGGAVWSALTLWTGGIAASLACHAVWTALMVALPPISPEDAT